MVKKTKSNSHYSKYKNIVLKLILIAVFALIGLFSYWKIAIYDTAANQIAIANIRGLIITSIENLKQPAVIDPKTGDAYFPPEKLYLPYSQYQLPLTYSIFEDGNGGTEFNISDKFTVGALSSKLYSAQNVEKLFDLVPELQACSRGVTVTYEKLSDESNYNLNSSHAINNGKTVYLYTEKACSELSETVELLKNLQSF